MTTIRHVALASCAAFALLAPRFADAAHTTEAVRSADEAITAGIDAERRMDPQGALVHFREALHVRPDDAFLHQKVAQQLSDSAFLVADPSERARLASEAFVHARRAVELDPDCAVARLSLAVLYGKLAVEGDIRTRVDYARRIHRHAEESRELDPGYAWAAHVLGRWHVEMSRINVAQRAIAGLLFGGLPRASLEEGTALLEHAVRLEGDAVPHHVELGFAYQRAGRLADARACWNTALALPSVRVYDAAAKERASRALAELPAGKTS